MRQSHALLSARIERRVFFIRGQRVMLDRDLAAMYGVSTTRLNQQVRRNINRFPDDFMFQITKQELQSLMLQNATSNRTRGGRRKLPFVFTEHGAVMAANVLKSNLAIRMSVHVVRAFVRLREELATHKELAQKLKELEGKLEKHDHTIVAIFETIRRLMAVPKKPKRRIGF
jgi:phage regulator Rha-like protein